MDEAIRVLLVDDHPLFRDALAARIREVVGDAVIAYSGPLVSEAISAQRAAPADLAVLDLDLGDGRSPVLNVSDLVKAGCRVLVVSALADAATVKAALQSGALGFVSKQASIPELKQAMEAVVRGEPFTSRDVAAILASEADRSVSLSERESMALILYASGMKIEAVARQMGVKTSTAQEYIKRVREKYVKAGTPAPTKTELYRRAREDGIVP